MSMSKEDEATLDQIAVAAMQSLLAAKEWRAEGAGERMAKRAYELAEAMMEERARRHAEQDELRGQETMKGMKAINEAMEQRTPRNRSIY